MPAQPRAARFPLTRRMTEIGPRTESNEYEVYQFILGMKGDIVGDWTYDVYGSLGKVELNTDQGGNVSREAWEELTYAPDGGVALCGGFNPFGAGAITPACADYHLAHTTYAETTEQNMFEATASGSLFELPAGKVMASVGYLYKEDSYEFAPDATLARQLPDGRFDIAGFNAALADRRRHRLERAVHRNPDPDPGGHAGRRPPRGDGGLSLRRLLDRGRRRQLQG